MVEKTDHDRIVEMHSILCDMNGNDGLCTRFQKHVDADALFRKEYYGFKRGVLVTSAFLVGSGGLTLGALKLFGG